MGISALKKLMRIILNPLKIPVLSFNSTGTKAATLRLTCILLSITFFINLHADQILTAKREVLSGKINLKAGKALLADGNNAEKEIALEEILDFTFDGIEPSMPVTRIIFPSPEKRGGVLPPGWKSLDVGYSKNRGSAVWQPENNNPSGVFTIRSAGVGFSPVSDSFHYAHTTIEKDGYAAVRIAGKSALDKNGCAGLMIRKNTDLKSKFVSIGVNQQGVPILEWRERDGSTNSSLIFTNRGEFNWVKLAWTKTNVIVGFSSDGLIWQNAEPININFNYPVNIGLFVYSGNEKYTAQSRFPEATIVSIDKPVLTTDKPASNNSLPAAVILRNGSMMVGWIDRLTDGILHLQFLNSKFAISTNEIGSIQFIALPLDWQNESNMSKSGIYLVNGIFIESRVSKIENRSVKILVQDKMVDFDIVADVAAVQFSPVIYSAASYEVKLKNGSSVYADYIKFADDAIVVGGKIPDEIKIAKSEIAKIRKIGNLEATPSITVKSQTSGAINLNLETVSGEKISGNLKLIDNEPIIEFDNGVKVKLRPDLIKYLKIKNATPETFVAAGLADKVRQFITVDFKQKTMRGRSYVANDVLYLEDYAPIQISKSPEPTYFLCYPVEGDFELIADVVNPESLPRGCFAGMLVQDSLNNFANGVFCGTDSKSIIFIRKYDDRLGSYSKHDFRSPLKLKIERTRRRLTVSAFSSRSGSTWNYVNSYERDLPPVMYVGFAVVNTNMDSKSVIAGFKNVEIKMKQISEAQAKVILVNGSSLNCDILSCNETMLTISSVLSPKMAIPINRIAYISFGDSSDVSGHQSSRRGVLFKNNDFFECEFKGIEGDNVIVSSTLFGIRYYRIGDPVKRVCLNPVMESKSVYEITFADKSKIFANSLNVRGAGFILYDELSDNKYELPISLVAEVKKR